MTQPGLYGLREGCVLACCPWWVSTTVTPSHRHLQARRPSSLLQVPRASAVAVIALPFRWRRSRSKNVPTAAVVPPRPPLPSLPQRQELLAGHPRRATRRPRTAHGPSRQDDAVSIAYAPRHLGYLDKRKGRSCRPWQDKHRVGLVRPSCRPVSKPPYGNPSVLEHRLKTRSPEPVLGGPIH